MPLKSDGRQGVSFILFPRSVFWYWNEFETRFLYRRDTQTPMRNMEPLRNRSAITPPQQTVVHLPSSFLGELYRHVSPRMMSLGKFRSQYVHHRYLEPGRSEHIPSSRSTNRSTHRSYSFCNVNRSKTIASSNAPKRHVPSKIYDVNCSLHSDRDCRMTCAWRHRWTCIQGIESEWQATCTVCDFLPGGFISLHPCSAPLLAPWSLFGNITTRVSNIQRSSRNP